MYCPSCGSLPPTSCAFCPTCGASLTGAAAAPSASEPLYGNPQGQPAWTYPAPDAGTLRMQAPHSDARRLYEVASSYRTLLLAFGAQMAGGFAINVLSATRKATHDGSAVLLGLALLLLGVIALTALGFLLVSVYRLTSATQNGVPILWLLGMFIPCVGLFLLLSLANSTNKWLHERGVKVGLLGPGADVVQQLKMAAGA